MSRKLLVTEETGGNSNPGLYNSALTDSKNQLENSSVTEENIDDKEKLRIKNFGKLKGKNWVFTNYKNIIEPYSPWGDCIWDATILNSLMFQLEKCPTTGKLHYQGWVSFKKTHKGPAVQEFLKYKHMRIDLLKGTRQQNIDYCSKPSSRIAGPWTWGDVEGKQGKRNDLTAYKDQILKNPYDEMTLINEFTPCYFKYAKATEKVQAQAQKILASRWRPLETTVYYGLGGKGKSRKARGEPNDYSKVYSLPAPTKTGSIWFNGYNGEDTLLIDDFDGWIDWATFKHILDGYPWQGQTKYGFIWANWTKVIITSNDHPDYWFLDKHKNPRTLANSLEFQRRLHKIFEFDEDGNMNQVHPIPLNASTPPS